MRNLFTKYSDDRERSLRSTETDLRLPLLKTADGQKAFSYRGAKLWNSLERSKIGTFPEIFQGTTTEGGTTLLSCSFSYPLYFIVN